MTDRPNSYILSPYPIGHPSMFRNFIFSSHAHSFSLGPKGTAITTQGYNCASRPSLGIYDGHFTAWLGYKFPKSQANPRNINSFGITLRFLWSGQLHYKVWLSIFRPEQTIRGLQHLITTTLRVWNPMAMVPSIIVLYYEYTSMDKCYPLQHHCDLEHHHLAMLQLVAQY